MRGASRVVAIVVARMGSTRVPGKSMIELCGHPVIWHVIQAAKSIRGVSAVCLATSDLTPDDQLAMVAADCEIPCYRGNAERVLDRLHGAAAVMDADIVVDIGGDCPLLDPEVLERALADYLAAPCDYLCNYSPPTFPEGMDVNIISRVALEKAWQEAIAPSQRVHPFSYLTYHPELFSIRNFETAPDLSFHHWSLDFPEDVPFIMAIYERIWRPHHVIRMREIVDLIERDPLVAEMDRKLLRPKVSHAFWNSPGIVCDMHDDMAALACSGHKAYAAGDLCYAALCYAEIMRLAERLYRQVVPGG